MNLDFAAQTVDLVEAQNLALEESVIRVNRSAKVIKGGRRFSFSALCVVGNRNGVVGFGYAKAREVPVAVEKAVRDARKSLIRVPVIGTTIPHQSKGEYRSSSVILVPAAPGTGIIAGATVRAMVELAGVRDILTKAYGSTNPLNLVQATMLALVGLRTKDKVESLRGVTLS